MQLDIFAEPAGSYGKTSRSLQQQPGATLLSWLVQWQDPSSLSPQVAGDPKALRWVTTASSNGPSLTRNGSEWRSGAAACSLSSILETGQIEARYFLSATACAGILRRAATRESVTGTLSARTQGGGGLGTDFECQGGLVAGTLSANPKAAGSTQQDAHAGLLIPAVAHTLRAEGFDASEDGTRGTPLVPVAFDTTQVTSKANVSNPKPGDPCHPLCAGAHAPAIAFGCKDSDPARSVSDQVAPLRAMGHQGATQTQVDRWPWPVLAIGRSNGPRARHPGRQQWPRR